MGNTLQQSEQYIQASRWHIFYLFSGQGIPRMLQGEILAFCCTFGSLECHLFASIEKFGSHVWKVANVSLVAYSDLFVSLVMIPALIRLANDIETNPGPAIVDNIDRSKTICAPYPSSNVLSSLSSDHFSRVIPSYHTTMISISSPTMYVFSIYFLQANLRMSFGYRQHLVLVSFTMEGSLLSNRS